MLKKITLVSNNICYGPEHEIGSEVEQRLTVNAKGGVWFSAYTYNRDFGHFPVGRKIQKKIPSETAEKLLGDILHYFEDNEVYFITDVGGYDLTLFFDDETTEAISGPLLCENKELQKICDFARDTIGIDGMFMFDGN